MPTVRLTELNNFHVLGMVDRINQFVVELRDGQSRSVQDFHPKDETRLESYISSIRDYKTWVMDQEWLDLPKSSDRFYPTPENPVVVYDEIDNLEVRDCLRVIELTRDELIYGSESARRSSGFAPADAERVDALVNHLENFLKNYIQVVTPLDLPETSTPGDSNSANDV